MDIPIPMENDDCIIDVKRWGSQFAYASDAKLCFRNVTVDGFCNAPGKNESSNRRHFSLL